MAENRVAITACLEIDLMTGVGIVDVATMTSQPRARHTKKAC